MKRFYAILVLLLILSVALFLARSNFLNIKQTDIKILGADCVTQSDVLSLVAKQNQKIFLFKEEQLVKDLKQKYNCIESAKVNKSYPGKIAVNVEGKKAVLILDNLVTNFDGKVINLPDQALEATPSSQSALVSPNIDDIAKNATESGKFLVSKSGEVFSDQPTGENVPTFIFLGEKLTIGQRLDVNGFSNALLAVNKIGQLNLPIKGAPLVYNNYLEIKSSNPNTLILALDKDILREVASLQLILETGKMNSGSKSMDSVDLRFNKPVVVYSAK